MKVEHLLNTEQAQTTYYWLNQIQAQYQSPQIHWQILFAKTHLALNPMIEMDIEQLSEEATELTAKTLHSLQSAVDLDPQLILSVALAYQERNINIPKLTELVDKIGQSLQSQSATVQVMGRVRNMNKHLIELGCNNQLSQQPKAIQKQLKDDAAWLTLPNDELIEMALHCIADNRQLNEQESEIISLIALGEMRNNQIDAASKLLKLVIELGVLGDATQESLNFVAMQRRRQGYYGFNNPLVDEQVQSDELLITYHLPLTINILWLFNRAAIRMQSVDQ